MKYQFTIRGETPAKKNSRQTLKNGKTIPSKRYLSWHENALLQLRASKGKPKNPISNKVIIMMYFYHGDLRRRDGDNGASSVLDTLVDAGILEDDNWQIVKIITIANYYDKENPRCEITINEM